MSSQAAATYTLDSFQQTYLQHYPQAKPTLEMLTKRFADPSRTPEQHQSDLADLLQREVACSPTEDELVLSWQANNDRSYRLVVPQPPAIRASEDTAEENPFGGAEPVAETVTEQPVIQADEPAVEAEVEQPINESVAQAPDDNPVADDPGPPPGGGDAPPRATGVFGNLAALLGNATLLLTVARVGGSDEEPQLCVNVIPKATEKDDEVLMHPMSLTGTPTELDDPDEGFAEAIRVAVKGNVSIKEGIKELEQAKKSEEEAKKTEADAKKKEAASKKKKAAKTEQKTQEETKGSSSLFAEDDKEAETSEKEEA